MSQIGAPGWQQALPECLVCNWREEKQNINVTAKGSQWAQEGLSTPLIPVESSPPLLGGSGGIIPDISH